MAYSDAPAGENQVFKPDRISLLQHGIGPDGESISVDRRHSPGDRSAGIRIDGSAAAHCTRLGLRVGHIRCRAWPFK